MSAPANLAKYRDLGRRAFADGLPSAPSLSPAIREALAGLEVGQGGKAIMEAYHQGWTEAMLAAPLCDCKFCEKRCFVERYLTTGPNRVVRPWVLFHMATCPAGMAYDLEAVGQTHKTAVSPDNLRMWLALGKRNPWIRQATDPPFSRDSFHFCKDLDELQEMLTLDLNHWPVGNAFAFSDLCFIQQAPSGDEWLTIRHALPFESITFAPVIERGEFREYIGHLLAATREQCRTLTWRPRPNKPEGNAS
jgi:hypothetical protein